MSDLKSGDSVSWMHARSNGSSIGFSTRNGKITQINGGLAFVKMRNGRVENVWLKQLRKDGEKTELTEIFEDMAKSAKAEGVKP
jgi:hypothetical protein